MKRIVVIAFLVAMSGCRKFPENNFVSFRSVEKRLYQRWHLIGAYGTYNPNSGIYYTFSEDHVLVEEPGGSTTTEARLLNNQTEIQFGSPASGQRYRIRELTNRKLSFLHVNDADLRFIFEADR